MVQEAPQVKLPRFEGPLDLLLYLIRQQEIDIHDIPLSEITHQYLMTLDTMRSMNLEVAGEFILMVSYLLYIKAQMLLPRPQIEGEIPPDPREPLVQKLLEYQKFKQIGEDFKRLEIERAGFFPRGIDPASVGFEEILKMDFSIYDLYRAYTEAIKASPEAPPALLTGMLVDIEERMNYIRKKVTELGKINFFTLTEGLNKYLTVATFVALLELARQKILTVKQARQFGNIIISAEGNVKA